MKKTILFTVVFLTALFFAGGSGAKAEPVDFENALNMFSINCEHWLTYEEGVFNYIKSVTKDDSSTENRDNKIAAAKAFAQVQQIAYISGLLNAYEEASYFDDADYELDLMIGEYKTKVDEYCKLPKNNEKRVSEALLDVHKLINEK